MLIDNNSELFIDIYFRLYNKLEKDFLLSPLSIPFFEVNIDEKFEAINIDLINVNIHDYGDIFKENQLKENFLFGMIKDHQLLQNKYETNDKHIILFDAEVYFKKILQSYKYKRENIWYQFSLDFPRSTIFVNNINVKIKDQFLELLKGLNEIYMTIKINNQKVYIFDLLTLVIMLCNQSSYAFPYMYLNKIYSQYEDKFIICSLDEGRNIKITNKDVILFEINAIFGIKNINTNKILSKIKTKLIITTNIRTKSKGNLLKNEYHLISEKFLNKYGFLIWKFISY